MSLEPLDQLACQLYCDGASRGNPGPSSYGYVLLDEKGQCLFQEGKEIGIQTNNFSEYKGLIEGLKKAHELQIKKIKVFLDSQLVVRQIRGEYKIKSPHLFPLLLEAKKLLDQFEWKTITHIPREDNKIADELANRALDLGLGSSQQ